jgi:hypothetical protein
MAPASAVFALVAKWSARHPELADRLERAAALVANVTPGDYSPNVFFVEGSDGHRYLVRVNRKARTSTCSCLDHQMRGFKCKHVLAVALCEKAPCVQQLKLHGNG